MEYGTTLFLIYFQMAGPQKKIACSVLWDYNYSANHFRRQMFMRRRDREVTDPQEIQYILDHAITLHLGLVEDGMPYVVPLNYGYTFEGDRLVFYVHGAKEGRKLDVVRKNGKCCAQLDCDGTPFAGKTACQYGYSYYSLMGFGNARIVEDPQEKIKALTLLMKTQTGKDFEFNERLVSIVSVIRIECDQYTAKHRPLPAKPTAE